MARGHRKIGMIYELSRIIFFGTSSANGFLSLSQDRDFADFFVGALMEVMPEKGGKVLILDPGLNTFK